MRVSFKLLQALSFAGDKAATKAASEWLFLVRTRRTGEELIAIIHGDHYMVYGVSGSHP